MARARSVWIISLASLLLPACLPRERLNLDCEWTETDRQSLDLSNPSHRQHLNHDVDIAIELVVRNADAEHGRRYGYNAHGGYVDAGRFRDACREKLLASIANAHGLTIDQVRDVRVTRDWRIVSIASLPLVAFYYLGSVVLCRIWTSKFSADESRIRFAAIVITSLAASVAGVQLAILWFNTAEMIRIGNDHLGHTRAFPMTTRYLTTMFLTGVIVFWLAALRQYRCSVQAPATEPRMLRLNS